jgi:hypothetical protein
LVRQPSFSAVLRIFSAVFGATPGSPRKAHETVDTATPAAMAISRRVGGGESGEGISGDSYWSGLVSQSPPVNWCLIVSERVRARKGFLALEEGLISSPEILNVYLQLLNSMKRHILIASLLSFATLAASGQVILHQWDFSDTAGTDISAVSDSVGSLSFGTATNNPGNWTTNGTGLLTGGDGGHGHADITNINSGVYQFDLTGVTFTALSGGTDDSIAFGLRSFTSGNITRFEVAGDSSSNQSVLVIGNENGSSGLDFRVIDNNVATLVSDATSDFTGTYDFRILLDFDNDTADYLYQLNGGGFTNIVSQQFNAVAAIDNLYFSGSTFSDTISINQATFTQVPEPSTYALLLGVLVLGLALMRRRMR